MVRGSNPGRRRAKADVPTTILPRYDCYDGKSVIGKKTWTWLRQNNVVGLIYTAVQWTQSANQLQARTCAGIVMPKQNSVCWTGNVRLCVRNGRFVKYTNNIINSGENYAWYLDCKHSALGEINATRICAFPIEAHWAFILFRRSHPTTCWWPLPRGPLWCNCVAAGHVWWVASGER